jgi:hypothetical protein
VGEYLHKADYRVATCPYRDMSELIRAHHYARGGPNTAVFRHGLYRLRGDLVGAAQWLPPTRRAAESVADERWRGVLTLSRLVVTPGEPTNAASFLLGRSIRLIRADPRWHTLVTWADERQGHTGRIYLATNWEYAGSRMGDPVYLDTEGRQVARKCAGRSRTGAEMAALGYRNVGRSIKHKYVLRLRRG